MKRRQYRRWRGVRWVRTVKRRGQRRAESEPAPAVGGCDRWRSVRWQRILEDHLTCQRCRRHFPYGHGLSAHHIRPRDDGGDESMGNLIALCVPCHDWIEGRGLCRAEIVGSWGADDIPLPLPERTERDPGPVGFVYRSPGLHHFWIDGGWYAAADRAEVLVWYVDI